jgi:DNA-binding MarR family transcriptional regulator
MSQAPEGRPEIHEAIRALQQLAELFDLRRRQLASEVGIGEAQWRLLEEVAEEHFMPSMFARQRECSPAAVSRGLRELRDAGLVEASIGAEDGRQRVYRLTARGRGALRRMRRQRERAVEAVWTRFSARELRGFVRFADQLSESLSRYARDRRAEARPAST